MNNKRAVAQLVAHVLWEHGVVGSSPSRPRVLKVAIFQGCDLFRAYFSGIAGDLWV